MATSLSGNVNIGLTFSGLLSAGITGVTNTSKIISSGLNGVSGVNLDPSITFTDGTGASQANKWFLGYRTLTAGSSDNLDLSGTAIQDPFGNNLAFTTIKSMVLVIDYAAVTYDGTKYLEFGPASVSNAFIGPFGDISDKLTFDKFFCMVNGTAAGWAVTASTADLLHIKNTSAASLSYLLWLQGN
jgi:hypothetical protein